LAEEREELRSRLDEYDPGFLSILRERVRGIESEERETIPADQVIAEGRLGPRARPAMSAVFDKEARQEYLDAIRFYGKGAERFSDALAACVQKNPGIAKSVSIA
jgi:hypothetical protein